MKKPGVLASAFIGLILTVPLTAIFYLFWKIARLPFVVFDLFDWFSQHLPGPIITSGIETMVSIIRAFSLGPTADVAKAGEQMMAVVIFLAGGFVVALIIRSVISWLGQPPKWPATFMGGLAGLPVLMISLAPGRQLPAGTFWSGLWILFMFLAWGHTLGWVLKRLIELQVTEGSTEIPGRRRFLYRLGGITAAVAVFGTGIGAVIRKQEEEDSVRWSSTHPLPNAGSAVIPAPGTRPEFTSLENHYRIDIDTMPPHIHLDKWKLNIGGLVEQDLNLTMAEIKSHTPMNQFVTLECISNYIAGDLISTTRWTGVSMQDMIPLFRIKPEAAYLKITAADGFTEFVSIGDIYSDRRIMLCYAWDGVPLFQKHGYPLRIYLPDHYGMKQPKWIESIEVTAQTGDGYWVKRGWDREARVKATSVIDTVADSHIYQDEQGQQRVPIGGIAYAGARGISKVELKMDNGPWIQAELRTPLSETTWVIWRHDALYLKGRHEFTVRCYEGDGTPQIERVAKPHPSGATGLHTLVRTI